MDCTRRAAGVARSFPGWLQDHGVAASGWRQTFAQQAVTSASADGRGESLCHHREDESGAVEHDTLSSRHNEPGMRRSSSRRIDASPRNLQQQHFSSPSQRGSGSSLGGLQLGEFARHSIHVRHSQSWGHRLWSTQWGESMLRSDQRCSALGGVALAHSKAGAGPATELASSPDQLLPEDWHPKRQALDMRAVPSTKVCTVCETELPAADFAWRVASPDGLEFRCRACYAVQSYAARGRVFPGLRVSEKRCNVCQQVRPGTFFAAARATADGLQPRCRTCAAKNTARRLARIAGERAESARFDAPPVTTTCSKCARELPTEAFHRDIYSFTGRSLTCPTCNYVRVTERRKAVERPVGPLVTEKRCSACSTVKSADFFYFHAYSTDGLTYQCRECWQAHKKVQKERKARSQ